MTQPNRIIALDAFRGLTIAAMIMVNQPGSWDYGYAQMRHAAWHGCTITDLIFPFFLIIVGVSMWFSFKKTDHKLTSVTAVKIVRRTIVIFLLGIMLSVLGQLFSDYYISISTLRITGVLQRIAFCYGIAAIICLTLNRTKIVITSVIILVGYWFILWVFGGNNPYEIETTIVGKIDAAILGANHLRKGYAVDTSGLFSSIPAIVHVLWGFLLGRMIDRNSDKKELVLNMFLLGIPALLLAQFWGYFFPINKTLWSSSYVLYSTGWGFITLAFFVWIIDIKKNTKWISPLLVFGLNPLFAYIFSEAFIEALNFLLKIINRNDGIFITDWIYNNICVPLLGNLNGSVLYSIIVMIFYWAVLSFLYRRRIYIKI